MSRYRLVTSLVLTLAVMTHSGPAQSQDGPAPDEPLSDIATALDEAHASFQRSIAGKTDEAEMQDECRRFRDKLTGFRPRLKAFLGRSPSSDLRQQALNHLFKVAVGRVRFSAAANELEATLSAWEDAKEDFPEDQVEPMVRSYLARLLHQKGRVADALPFYRRIVAGVAQIKGPNLAGETIMVNLLEPKPRIVIFWESG